MMHIDELTLKERFSIAEDMIDWVRVINQQNTVVYANKKMVQDLGELKGKKCYEVFGRTSCCEDCISFKTLQSGTITKHEVEIQNKVYMVISSPMKDDKGNICGCVEVFRDITNERELTKKLHQKNKKMSDDISFARNMQYRMLPLKGVHSGINIDYLYESSELLSGDFFDIFKIDSKNIAIYMCDVVGHGVSASLLTIFVRQSLRTMPKGNIDLNNIMKELHRSFLALNLDYDKYFSMFFGIYNKSTKQFRYVNAGHNSIPIVMHENGNIAMLEAKGYPICNIFDTVEYEENSIDLFSKDKIFFYTDGITESKSEDGQEFGIDRLVELIKDKYTDECLNNNIMDNIKMSLRKYSKTQKDDYALLMAEII